MFAMPRAMICVLFLTLCSVVCGQSYENSSHGNHANLPLGCATCHVGHGTDSTPMLVAKSDETCYQCHSSLATRMTAIQRGGLSNRFVNLPDISLPMRKKYNHYIPTYESHTPVGEGENNCAACHNAHYARNPNPLQGVRGITLQGFATNDSQYEYEVCFRCHSQPAGNMQSNLRDIRLEFYSANAISSHPVDRAVSPADSKSVSLINRGKEYVLTCSSCHGNSDLNGPRGLHGSDYPYLLVQNLEIKDHIPESEKSAELCYSCHDRKSVIANESFLYHAQHVNGEFSATPCMTCHSGHGSLSYSSLIAFSPRIVSPTSTGLLSFQSSGEHAGICYLTCHNVEHDGWSYAADSIAVTPVRTLAAPKPLVNRPVLRAPRFRSPNRDKERVGPRNP